MIMMILANEKLEEIEEKINDYFDAGVQLVWYISPKQEQIYAYSAPAKLTILKGTNVCSAAPVLSDFSFEVGDMFVKREK